MFKRIMVAVDERGHADHAVAVAADLAVKFECPLLLLTVMADSGLVEELGEMAQGEGLYVNEITQRVLDETEQVARNHGASDIVRLDLEGEPVATILEAAKANAADLIVLGAHICGHAPAKHERDVPHEVSSRAACACMIVR